MSYADFFLNSRATVVQLECLEIRHSAFSKTYRIVRNAVGGVKVKHECGCGYTYEYYPCSMRLSGPSDDLDHVLTVNFGDLGELLPLEMDNVRLYDSFREFPSVEYRTYRSDDLSAPLYGPLLLEVRKINFTREGVTFEARAPSLNSSKTGERYSIARFPMLKGLL